MAAETIKEFLVGLGIEVDQKKLAAFEKRLGTSKGKMQALGGAAKATAKLVTGVTVAAVGLSVALFKLVEGVAETGDRFAKEGKKIGISAVTLQEWSFAAERAGADSGKLVIAVSKMAKNINDARIKGLGPFVDQMEDLGIKIEEFDGLDTEQIFGKLADITAGIEDPIQRAAFAMDVFGRSGRDLIPLLVEGSEGLEDMRKEARRLGLSMSNEAAKNAEIFVDTMTDVRATLAGVKFEIAGELIPAVREQLELFKDWAIANRGLIAKRVLSFVQQFIRLMKRFVPAFARAVTTVADMTEALGGMQKVLIGLASAWAGMKIAAGLAVVGFGPGGAIIGAFIAILPHAINLGNELGEIAFNLTEIGKKANKLRGASGQQRGRLVGTRELSPVLRRDLRQARAERTKAARDLEKAEKELDTRLDTRTAIRERDAARRRLNESNKTLQTVELRAANFQRKLQEVGARDTKKKKPPKTTTGGKARVKPLEGTPQLSAFGAEVEGEITRRADESARRAGAFAITSGQGRQAAEKAAKAAAAETRRTLRAAADRGELTFQEPDSATLAELVQQAKSGLPFDLTREAERMRAPVTITVQNFDFDQDIEINIQGEGLDPQTIADRVIEDQQEAMSQAAQNFLPVVSR